MAAERPGGLDVAHSPREVLAAAVRRVSARLPELYPLLAPGGVARAEGYLATLQAKLDEVIQGGDAGRIRKWLSGSPMYGPLMDALVRELVHEEPGCEATAVATLAVLRAWSSVRVPAEVRPEKSPQSRPESLRSRMREPDAFELLVEIAHDFRSPLTSILFLAEALRDGHSGPVTDVQRSQLGLVYSAAFGLATIASDVMDLAREEKDLIAGEAEPFSISELFQSVERMVRPIVEEKGLELRVVVQGRWQGLGHPHALQRVLLNLTTNALKFTDEGTVEVGVRALPYARLEYYVQDTGRGISSEQQKKLFQPFQRRSQKPEEGHYFSGSGIGLSMARRLLHAMGSDLRLDSSDERGTRFSFVLRSAAAGRG